MTSCCDNTRVSHPLYQSFFVYLSLKTVEISYLLQADELPADDHRCAPPKMILSDGGRWIGTFGFHSPTNHSVDKSNGTIIIDEVRIERRLVDTGGLQIGISAQEFCSKRGMTDVMCQ